MSCPRLLRMIAAALTLTACGGLGTWAKAEMSAFDRDDYECRREASYPYTSVVGGGGAVVGGTHLRIDADLYGRCMKLRGYMRAK